jgi:hypothetical protein
MSEKRIAELEMENALLKKQLSLQIMKPERLAMVKRSLIKCGHGEIYHDDEEQNGLKKPILAKFGSSYIIIDGVKLQNGYDLRCMIFDKHDPDIKRITSEYGIMRNYIMSLIIANAPRQLLDVLGLELNMI